jgi:DnaJ-like protein
MLDFLVEKKIQEAMACGAFDHLPGAGQPLELGDDALVPEELRVAYRILKNAGFVPPEVETINEIAQLERLAMGNATAVKKLALLKTRIEARYYDKAIARLGR